MSNREIDKLLWQALAAIIFGFFVLGPLLRELWR